MLIRNIELKNKICFILKENFPFKKMMRMMILKEFPLHIARSDGKILYTESGKVLSEKLSKTGRAKVTLTLVKGNAKKGIKQKRTVAYVDELIAAAFLRKPKENGILYHKNGDDKDSAAINLAWFYIFDYPTVIDEVDYILPIEDETNEENFLSYKKTEIDSELGNPDIDNFSFEEESNIKELSNTDESEEKDEDEEDENENFSENIFSNTDIEKNCPEPLVPPHEPIYKQFLDDPSEYNLNGIIIMNNKTWKPAKYKHYVLSKFLISEDMELYSICGKKIIADEDLYIHENGDTSYRFTFFEKLRSVYLKDILASTFLRIPENAVMAVQKIWNRDFKKRRYKGQKFNYKQICWLTIDDFKNVKGSNGKVLISKRGDLYYMRKYMYEMYIDKIGKNGLRKSPYIELLNKSFILSILTGLAFVSKRDHTYRFLMHQDNDLQNDHHNNLIWVNTLEGRHSDGMYYYNVPSFPLYMLSETNIPYSYKGGVFKKLKLMKDGNGYNFVSLHKNRKKINIRFNRLVAATRNLDYTQDLPVDHKNRIKDQDVPENLRSVSVSVNNKNRDVRIGKKVMQIDKNDNIIIHDNVTKAAENLGSPYVAHNIRNCACKNNLLENGKHTSGDFIWKYTEKYEKYIPKTDEYFIMLDGIFQGVLLEYENYMVSNFGTFINVEKGYAKKTYNSNNYPIINFYKNGIQYAESVHNILGLVFVPGRTNEKNVINHLDEIKGNFNLKNLEWSTNLDNILYSAYKQGIPVRKICIMTGNVISVHDSRLDGARSCGKENPSGVNIVCRGEGNTAYGFFWEDIPFDEIHKYPELTINKRKALYGN